MKKNTRNSIKYYVSSITYSIFTKRKLPTTNGFSLIELLVAISIVAVLTTLGIANFIGVRERARDAQRKTSINELKTMLEFIKIDTVTGIYPTTNTLMVTATCGQPLVISTTTYIKKFPCDPTSGNRYTYTQTGAGSGFTLLACLENDLDQDRCTSSCPPCPAGTVPYVATNP